MLYTGTNSLSQKEKVLVGGLRGSVETGITATASGTQATAYQLTARLNRIATCATNNDSVALPPPELGLQIEIYNDGAATAQVYGYAATADTIDGVATATGVVLTNAKRCVYTCMAISSGIGAWVSNMGVKSA
jgi:hypothetical protein